MKVIIALMVGVIGLCVMVLAEGDGVGPQEVTHESI